MLFPLLCLVKQTFQQLSFETNQWVIPGSASIVGDFRARQIEVFIGSALILVVAYLLVGWLRRYPNSVIQVEVMSAF